MAIVNINGLPGELAATGSSSTAIGSKHIVKKYPWIPNAGIDIGRLEKEIETDIQQIAELLFDIEEGKFSTGFEGSLLDLQRKLEPSTGELGRKQAAFMAASMAATRDVYNKEYGSYKE